MKHLLSILSSIFLGCCLFAQPVIQWQKTFGGGDFDEPSSIQQTNDGGFIVTGRTASNDGDILGSHGVWDIWTIKLDALGFIEWYKVLGGSEYDLSFDIQQTQDEGYIIVGFTQSVNGDISNNHGGGDVWIVKLSNLGDTQWEKTLGGSEWDEAAAIALTNDEGYIIAAQTKSVDGDVTGKQGDDFDYWIVKLSSTGSIQWQKTYGGSDVDTPNSIKQTTDGGYIISGETKSTDGDVSGNNGNVDFWALKLDSLGQIEWQNALGGTGLDVGTNLFEVSDGYIGCGYVGSHNSGDVTGHHAFFDYWIVKLNQSGELQWQKTLGGSDADWLFASCTTSDDGLVVAGPTRSSDGDVQGYFGGQDVWVLKLNSEGEVIWQKILGGSKGESCASIKQTADNGFILACDTWSNNNGISGVHGYNDFWIVKLAPESTPVTEAPTIAQLEIYPNPAQTTITLQTAAHEPNLLITITDMLGRTIQRQPIQNGKTVDVSTLATGMYIITATASSGKTYSGTFKKE